MKYHLQCTDDDLRQGCMQQDRLAQQSLYQRYFGRLLGISMRYTKNREDAVEVLNHAFLKIFSNLDKFQETGPFFGWMAKIVFHTAIDHVRHNNTYRRVIQFSVEADQPVESEASYRLDAEDLYALVQKISPASRAVFSLYVIDGYKHLEIAEMLGISVGTSKWHLSNARLEMKKQIEQYYQISE
ncbi:MAG: RNA polymerase sigma factor [Saprospiraceae bacterium]|nr:RNA polymerase sigma factor [Saprospiraceae bacterium]